MTKPTYEVTWTGTLGKYWLNLKTGSLRTQAAVLTVTDESLPQRIADALNKELEAAE